MIAINALYVFVLCYVGCDSKYGDTLSTNLDSVLLLRYFTKG